jgi:TolB-like protein/DNA-binding winged helix-turn-helix (wHTH) protein
MAGDSRRPQGERAVDTASNEQAHPRPGQAPGRWRFAGMELDEASARLRSNGAEHALDHGSFGVLVALLRQSGLVVGKDALLHAGWPGRVVSENSLTKAVGRLRHLLDDHEGELLCTAHGYGYRLAARAEWLPGAADPEPAPAPPIAEIAPAPMSSPPSPLRREVPRYVLVLAAAVLLTLVAGLSWLAWQRTQPVAPLAATRAGNALAVDTPSIAVLPFADMSEAKDQRYFSDGLADELLDRLAQLPQLRVASRTSSFALRDMPEDVQEIGRRLGVANVLEGSVRRDGERLRITVQLINVNSGFHLWSETYDERMTDLFAVQDRIARAVVAALRLKLLPGQDDAMTRHRTKSIAAYNEFMSGRRSGYAATPDNQRRAIAAYERAIQLDPEFSSAYAALADLLGGDAAYADSPEEVAAGKQRSLELMDRAIALEPDRADFYLARADFLYSTRHDWRAAQRDLDTAARLYGRRPSELLQRQCRLDVVLGRTGEAIANERLALQADPHSPWAWGQLGYHLAVAGRYEEAHRSLATAFKVAPDDDHIGYYEGVAWLLEGKSKEAIAAFDRSGSVFRLAGLAAARFDAGDEAGSQQALQTLVTKYSPIGAYQVAQAHAWRGDADQAFAWLERAAQQQDAGLMQLKFDPMLRRLHADPRYRAWLLRLKLDDASLAAIGMAPVPPPGS